MTATNGAEDQARWLLDLLASTRADGGATLDLAGLDDHFTVTDTRPEAERRASWVEMADRLGGVAVVEVDRVSDLEARLLVEADPARRYWLTVVLAGEPPHRIQRWNTRRALPAGMAIRDADAGDAAALAELERVDPIVLGDTIITVERDGNHYYEFARLMRDVAFVVAEHDGMVVAVMGGCTHPACIGGIDYRMGYAHRLRIHPAHQGGGLWGHLADAWYRHYPLGERIDCSYGYASPDNEAMQKAWATLPNKWPAGPIRVVIDCDRQRATGDSRLGTDDDVAFAVDAINATHTGEEVFVPYTVATLHERLGRAPDLYGIGRLVMTEVAVVGTWAAGRHAVTSIATKAQRVEQRRAIVLDYGFLAEHETEFECLLRGVCARLWEEGMSHLVVYSSAKSPGWDVLIQMAERREDFDYWTPQIPVPDGAADRGLYVDAICF